MSLESRLLPITRRGQFFEDDFFRDFQGDYSSAIHDVLDRWGGRSLLADQFANYRKARESEPQDDSSLAASISDTPESYVIVLDMTDYVSGEITVKTSGPNAVVDAKVGNSKKFHRSYPLPKDTNTEGVVAAMSDEGILTINAKRKKGASSVKKIEAATSVGEESKTNLPNYVSCLKIDVGQSDEGIKPQPSSSSDITESAASSAVQASESGGSETDRSLTISKHGQFFKDSFFENVWNDFDSAMDDMIARQKKRQEQRQEERQRRDLARTEVMQKMFQEQEEQWRRTQEQRLQRNTKAGQEMQEQLNIFQVPMLDRVSSYRTLRSWAVGEDSQASTITADDKAYKVLLDVKDFADGELDLKSDGEVLTVSGSKGGISFKREFSLPGLAAPEQVTASLSEDGVLTITAPKK